MAYKCSFCNQLFDSVENMIPVGRAVGGWQLYHTADRHGVHNLRVIGSEEVEQVASGNAFLGQLLQEVPKEELEEPIDSEKFAEEFLGESQ
jgi:hypothetical protein